MAKRSLVDYCIILVAYFIIGLIITYPLITKLTTHLYGMPGDNFGTLWSFWWNTTHPISWQAPAQPTLLASAKLLTTVVNEVTAYNLLLLLSYPLAGFAIYLIVHHFTADRSASFLAGFIYVLGPYHIYQSYVHLSLSMIAWLPFYFYALLLWLKDPQLWRASISGLLLAMVILDNYYYGYLAILLTILFVIGLIIQIIRGKLAFWTAFWEGVLAAAIAITIVTPFILPSFDSGASQEYSRPLRELFVFRASWWDFFVPPITHPIVGNLIHATTQYELAGSNYFERTLYLGYIPLFFAIIGSVRNKRSWLMYLLLILFVSSIVLATAPNVLAPFLHHWFAVFRVYSRFGLLSLMAIAILAGIGIASLSKGTRTLWLHLAFGLFILADFYPLLPSPLIDVTTPKPYQKALSTLPTGTVAIYPLASGEEERTNEYLNESRLFKQPLFNAISPIFHYQSVREGLERPDEQRTLNLLKRFGISYVVIRKDIYKEGRLPPELNRFYDPEYPRYLSAWNGANIPAIALFTNSVSLVYEDGQAAIYRLK